MLRQPGNPSYPHPPTHTTTTTQAHARTHTHSTAGSRRWRVLSYTTPIKQALGPRQAHNREVMEVAALTSAGFLLRTRCVSSGVPFGGSFANVVEWVGLPTPTGGCRLVVTGEGLRGTWPGGAAQAVLVAVCRGRTRRSASLRCPHPGPQGSAAFTHPFSACSKARSRERARGAWPGPMPRSPRCSPAALVARAGRRQRQRRPKRQSHRATRCWPASTRLPRPSSWCSSASSCCGGLRC